MAEAWGMLIDQELVKAVSRIQIRAIYKTHTYTQGPWCTISWTISIYAHVRTWLRASNGWFASAKTCCSVCNLCVELVGTTRGRQRYYTTKRIQYILSFGIFSIIFIIEPVQLVVRHHRANENNNNTESRFGARYLSMLYGRQTSIVCAFKIYIWLKSSQQQQPHKSC